MKITVKTAFVFIAVCMHCASALASTTYAIDNDLFSGTGRDRDYTGGLRFTVQKTNEVSWQTGLLQFTPDNLNSSAPVEGKRPYASLLYIARSDESHHTNAITRQTVSVGMLGLQIANSLQRAIHRATDSEQPNGYEEQISDGGEPTLRVGWGRYTPLWRGSGQFRKLHVVGETTLSVGYHTSASVGVGFNLSQQPHFWGASRYHFQPLLDEPTNHAHSGLFGGIRMRVVGYNAFLQGQFRSSPSKLQSDQVRRFVSEAWLGFATSYKGLRISYALRANSPEYKSGKFQAWGALTVSKQLGSR